jgi:hypothetical protein
MFGMTVDPPAVSRPGQYRLLRPRGDRQAIEAAVTQAGSFLDLPILAV